MGIDDKTPLVLFDLDGTLTRHDTFTGFIRYVHGAKGLISLLLRSAPAIAMWKMGVKSNVYAKLRMFSAAFKGMELSFLERKGEEFADKIDAMARPEILAAMKQAVSDGKTVAIVSASLEFWIRPWAVRHGVDCVVATRAAVCGKGCITGSFVGPNCEKEEKVRRLLKAIPGLAQNRSRFFVEAYGDSAGDAQMLDFADVAHKV